MKVCVVGLGYIGFPTACVVAGAGHDVLGVDVDSAVIEKLNNGGLHIVNEDGLADIAFKAFASGKLRVSGVPEPADVFVICVPTPAKRGDGAPSTADPEKPYFGADLSFVTRATRDVAPYVREGTLVILESTVPPGTTRHVVRPLLEKGSGLGCGRDFFLAHAPERVLPGNILHELVHNDRIVGGVDGESARRAEAFYRTFVQGEVVGTDATTAEMVKLMENTYRDVNIALANECALICEDLGIDVFAAIRLANRHPRVNILKPGPGVGGHCIAVDPWFIVEAAPRQARLIRLAREINSGMPRHVFSLFASLASECSAAGHPVEKVAILGAAYKPDVGDDRESPALEVAHLVEAAGYRVAIHDPYVGRFSGTPMEEVLRGADVAMLLTDHTVYRQELTPSVVKRLLRQPNIVDTRGFLGPEWEEAGFRLVRLGVRSPLHANVG